MSWWQRVRNEDRLERELDAELRYHFDREVADNVRMGMSEEQARRRARLDLGGDDPLKESCRDARGTRWFHDTAQDLRFAARLLLKDVRFTLPAVLALALGIGMNGTMFTIVNAMIRGLPIDGAERIMSIHARDGAGRWRGFGVSHLDFIEFQVATKTFAGLGAFSQSTITLGEDGRAVERASAAYVSANAFQLLGERPILGRDFVRQDDQPGAPAVVILGNRIWTTRYNRDPSIIGTRVRVNGAPSTVIGVMTDGFRFPVISDVWLPLARLPGLVDQARDMRQLQVFGKVADWSTRAQAQAEIESIAARLSREYPATNGDTGAVVDPFPGHFAPSRILMALMLAVGLVLLLACINVANLLLVRSVGRSRELAMRVALGATRWRIVRQLLVECGLLAVAAGTLGFGFVVVGVWLFASAVAGITFPYYIQWTIDGRVGLFVGCVCVGAALIAGLLPAVQASKLAANRSLKEGERSATRGEGRRRVTTALLTLEVALTMVLLAGAGLMMRSFLAVYRADSIIDAARVATMPLALPTEKYRTAEQRTAAYRRLEERLDASPDVSFSAFASVVPFSGGPSRQMSVDGRRPLPGEPQPIVSYVAIRGRYFDTLGLRVLRGRTFTDRDALPGSESAIVNQRLATMFFPNEDPVGRRICLTTPNAAVALPAACATIVGVSPTVRQQYFQEIDPVVYVPAPADASELTLIAASHSSPDAVAPLLRAEVFALDEGIAVNALRPLDQAMTGSRWGHRVFGGMLTAFAVVGLLLGAVGLYAVTAFAVVQRTQEIGVRMALGAQAGAVVRFFVTRAALPVGLGIGVGLAGALGIGRLLQRFLIQRAPPTRPSSSAPRCCWRRCPLLQRSCLRGERQDWTRSQHCGTSRFTSPVLAIPWWAMAMLEARRLVKRFYGHAIVDHVSFAVQSGEVVGYLGANGSGKTTTTRMLTGLLEPSSGDVLFDGREVRLDPVEFRRRLGYVPEEPHLYPFLSGREHLELIGRLRELPPASMDRKIAALLELFGLSEAKEQDIAGYSKGMKQKILILAALLHDPDVLIFDEPDSGLDVTGALVLRHLVGNLAARGKAILYTSHILEVVERLCTRVIVLHEGRVVADDSVQQLRATLASSSLEQVFAHLVLRREPEQLAQDIAEVVTAGA